jgi:signal transduction histidine kinase
MDVRLLARRLIGYLVSAVVLSPALLGALVVLHLWIADGDHRARPAAELVVRDWAVLCLAFVLALPLLGRVGRTLDRLMLRRQHGVRDALVALGKELPQLIDDRQRLADRLTGALVTRIPAAHASLHVIDTRNDDLQALSHVASAEGPGAAAPRISVDLAAWLALSARTLVVEEATFYGDAVASLRATLADLEQQRVTLLLPLILDGRLLAVLCLGEKLSGEIYERDEIELLETLLQEAAVALQNARLYADLRQQMDELRRTQGQLMQSAKLAAIGELAAGIAHEVNNPLMVILGCASGLRERPELASIHAKLDTIEAQATRAGHVIRGLLDFARRRPRHLEEVDVRAVIERALALVRDRLVSGAIEATTIFDESGPAVVGDRDELTQVFLNLFTNAADAMPHGGRLTVSTDVRRHETMAYLSIRVADTGAGIAAADRERVFESFFTTKPEGKGTGLGLAVTRDIVKNHEGTIEVEGGPGKGTVMVVNLPLAHAG